MKRSVAGLVLVVSLGAGADPGFDAVSTPWGPGRKNAGETYKSLSQPLPEGALRWEWTEGSLAVGAQYITRGEFRDNADFSAARGDHSLGIDQRARLSVRASVKERVGILIDLQDVRGYGSEPSPSTLAADTGLHQGYVDLHASEWLDVRVGRQEIAYGEERLVGALDWSMTGRAFDALFARFTAAPSLTLDAFASVLKPPAWITSDAGGRFHNSGNTFSGLYGRWREGRGGVDLYALGLVEDPGTAATGALKDNTRITGGARAFLNASNLSLVGEGALQAGMVGQASTPVRAGAFALKGTYTFTGTWAKPYVLAEFSGASDTFHQLFPTGHSHLGFMDYVGWQNVLAGHAAVGFRPGGAHVWLDVHEFQAWDPRAAWYAANGTVFLAADGSRKSGDMGTEIDLSATYPLTSSVALAGNASVFLPGQEAAAKGTSPSTWAFISLRTQL